MELVKELDFEYDFKSVKISILNYINDNKDLSYRFNGLSVQHRTGVKRPWHLIDGMESLKLYDTYDESIFDNVNEYFINTELEKIIKQYNLYRSRIMILQSRYNYSIHKDISWRLHIPIITNKNALFYFPEHNKHIQLEEGKVYLVNTTEKHTFINAGSKDRIHFIGCITTQ